MGMDAALYLRKSRAEEGMETDRVLARHREILEDCARRRGLHIRAVYPEVVSGESLCTRPQMLRLLEDVEADRFDCVLCMDLDRLSRGRMRDQGLILDTFKEHATRIVTPDKIYDLSDEEDEEYAELKTFLARREYKIINKRLQRGLRQSILEGCYCANPPYGYRRAVVDRKPTLEVNQEEARFVRLMFELYAQGEGCAAIAQKVSALGAVPRRSAQFSRNGVARILTSPTYVGKIVWNRSARRRSLPPERWTVVDGLHPALVSRELFDRCQAIYKGRSTPAHNNGTVRNPLAGLVFCARCGARMQLAGRYPQIYLACPTKNCCAAAQLPLVEQRVREFLQEELDSILLTGTAPDGEAETLWKTAQTCAKLRLTSLRRQRERLHALLELGEYDLPTFHARMEAISEQERQTEEILKEEPEPEPNPPVEEKSLWQVCERGDPALRNGIYKCLVEKIFYSKEKKSKPGEFTLEVVRKEMW